MKSENRYLFLTFLLLVLIGAPGVYSIVKVPNELEASSSMIASRSPASVDVQDDSLTQVRGKNSVTALSVTMDFACQKKNQDEVRYTEGSLLRLKSDDCLIEKWKEVSIINRTNGFTASLIHFKKGFTTDFIELEEGENLLAFDGIDEKGQKVEMKIKVNKRLPASL